MCIQNASIVPREFRFDYGFKWMVEQDGELYLPFLNFSGRRNRYNKEYKSIPKEYSTYSHFFKKALEAFDYLKYENWDIPKRCVKEYSVKLCLYQWYPDWNYEVCKGTVCHKEVVYACEKVKRYQRCGFDVNYPLSRSIRDGFCGS